MWIKNGGRGGTPTRTHRIVIFVQLAYSKWKFQTIRWNKRKKLWCGDDRTLWRKQDLDMGPSEISTKRNGCNIPCLHQQMERWKEDTMNDGAADCCKSGGHDHTRLYSLKLCCRIVSLTAAKTNRIFSVSKGIRVKITSI